MSTSLTSICLHCKLSSLQVQGCFNRCFIGARSPVYTLKSNNPDQFIHKAVTGEGKQSFPLWLQPSYSLTSQAPYFCSPLSVCVCQGSMSKWCRTILQLPVVSVFKCYWSSTVSLDKLIHTPVEVSGQFTVEITSCSLEVICKCSEYCCSSVHHWQCSDLTALLLTFIYPDKAWHRIKTHLVSQSYILLFIPSSNPQLQHSLMSL